MIVDLGAAPLSMAGARTKLTAIAALVLSGCTATNVSEELPSGAAAYAALPTNGSNDPAMPYQIGAYDVLEIKTLNEPDLTFENVPVDPNGRFSFPFLGSIDARGLTVPALESLIKTRLDERYTRDSQVTIFVKSAASQVFSVEGDVKEPGSFQYAGNTTLMSAIARAGSPGKTAKLDEVVIFRVVNGERFGAVFNLNDIREGRVPDPAIFPGDNIFVGFSAVKAGYEDFLRVAPLLNIFTRF